jgi:hypothetical protein
MNGKFVGRVFIVFVSLLLPTLLRAQELTANVVIHRANGQTRGKLYRGKDAVRLELPEEGRGAATGTVIIYDQGRQVTYFLNQAMKSYVERSGFAGGGIVGLFVPQKDNPCALLPSISKEGKCQEMGAERVNGRSTEKWQATQVRGGRTITEYAWVDSELHIAIKWQTIDQVTGQLDNIQLVSQPASLFTPPSDYRKLEMPAATTSNH